MDADLGPVIGEYRSAPPRRGVLPRDGGCVVARAAALAIGIVMLVGISIAIFVVGLALYLLVSFGSARPSLAHDAGDPDAAWYKSQTINPEAWQRLKVPFRSCCDSGDHFRTRFRLMRDGTRYGAETYEYWKDGAWRVIPPDVVKRARTPDGRPVLFIERASGKELCFIIDEEGI